MRRPTRTALMLVQVRVSDAPWFSSFAAGEVLRFPFAVTEGSLPGCGPERVTRSCRAYYVNRVEWRKVDAADPRANEEEPVISDICDEFAGRPVREFVPGELLESAAKFIYRIRLDWDDAESGVTFGDRFAAFLEDPESAQAPGLVVGSWGNPAETDSSGIVEALCAAADHLSNVRALFIGDIVVEECEVSWIRQSDMAPLFDAFPKLEHFRVRGSEGLMLGRVHSSSLKSLIVESGGLNVARVREILSSELPVLEHLELWLGDDGYGADSTVADLEPLLRRGVFPALRHLGLRNSQLTDEIATALTGASVLEQLEVLDLSLGTLGRKGAKALLANPKLANLQRLVLHHHFVAPKLVAKLKAFHPAVDLDDPQEEDDFDGEAYRYVAVSE